MRVDAVGVGQMAAQEGSQPLRVLPRLQPALGQHLHEQDVRIAAEQHHVVAGLAVPAEAALCERLVLGLGRDRRLGHGRAVLTLPGDCAQRVVNLGHGIDQITAAQKTAVTNDW